MLKSSNPDSAPTAPKTPRENSGGFSHTVLTELQACSTRRWVLDTRVIREANNIALKMLSRFPEFEMATFERCASLAANSSYEYANFARFHNMKDTLMAEGGGIAVFGSARPKQDDPNPIRREGYEMARESGRVIASSFLPIDKQGKVGEAGAAVVSGAGPGYMLASCELAKGKVWGHAIFIPHENGLNPYVPAERSAMYQRFPFRKTALMDDMTRGVMVLPGGFGTIEEFMEVLSLTESNTLPKKPIVFVGADFWNPVISLIKESGITSKQTLNSLVVVSTPEQAMTHILGWYERNTEEKEYKPFRMLENYFNNRAAVLTDNEMRALESQCPVSLKQRADHLSQFILQEFELLLSGRKRDEQGNLIKSPDIWNQCDEPVIYGTLKWFTDRFFVECGLAKADVKEFVLQLGTDSHPDFVANRDELLRRGLTVACRLPAHYREERRWESGLMIYRPGVSDPLLLPTKYRLTAMDVATQSGRIKGILTSKGNVSTMHRLSEAMCWKQTGKLPSDVHIAALVEEHGGFLPEFLRNSNVQLLKAGFIAPEDTELVKQRYSSSGAVDALKIS